MYVHLLVCYLNKLIHICSYCYNNHLSTAVQQCIASPSLMQCSVLFVQYYKSVRTVEIKCFYNGAVG